MSYPAPSDRKYGAKGDGRDDSVALQKWADDIAGKAGTLNGKYLTGKLLQLHAGTTIYGSHRNVTMIGAHPSLPDAGLITVAPNELVARIKLYNIGFVGGPERREANVPMIEWVGGDRDILFSACGFSHWKWLLAISGNQPQAITFDDCEFAHWGSQVVLREPTDTPTQPPTAGGPPIRGQCLFMGGYAIWAPEAGLSILGCDFHDSTWHALHWGGARWRVLGNTASRLMEGFMFGGGTDSVIERNTVMGIRRRDCAANVLECGTLRTRIANNTFGDVDHACINIGDPVDTEILDNTCIEAEQEAPVGGDAGTLACIAITSRGSRTISGLTIERNTGVDYTGRGSHGITLYHVAGDPWSDVLVRFNNLGTRWKGEPILTVGDDMRGRNFVLE